MQNQGQRIRLSFGGSLTSTIRTLLWINGLTFVFYSLASPEVQGQVFALLGLVPGAVTGEWALWQPITYLFLHGNFWHLLFNMLGLWWFGTDLERFWGAKRFLRFYFFTGVGGALAAIAMAPEAFTITVGASGAIFGVLVGYAILFPNREIYLYFVLPVKAKYLVTGFCLITAISLLRGQGGTVSHIAHFGGIVFALLWFGYLYSGFNVRSYLKGLQKNRRRRKFRVVPPKKDDDDPFGTYDNKTIH